MGLSPTLEKEHMESGDYAALFPVQGTEAGSDTFSTDPLWALEPEPFCAQSVANP